VIFGKQLRLRMTGKMATREREGLKAGVTTGERKANGLGKKTVLDVIRSINGIRISIRKLRDCSACILQSGLPPLSS
jgi:hypothetical protein